MARIDLAALAFAKTRRRRPIRLATVRVPTVVLGGDLAAIYRRVVTAWRTAANERIVPTYIATLAMTKGPTGDARLFGDALARLKDDVPGLGGAIGNADGTAQRLVLSLTPELRDWTLRLEGIHRRKFLSVSKTATNVDLAAVLSINGVATTLQSALERNVSLVRSVSDVIRSSIADSVFASFTARAPATDLAKEINAATQLGAARSLRIASDQTTKLAAALDETRQREIGIDQFVWIHSGKVHFRPAHKARDGLIYSWDDNDLDGDLPGVAINCGCKAQAYLDPEDDGS